MQTRIIAVLALKGGAAKTTTVVHLGTALAARGRRVLLVDLDPQRDLGHALKVSLPDAAPTISEVLKAELPLAEVLVETREVSFAPAGRDLALVETRLSSHQAFQPALKPLLGSYDYVLIDTPRGLGVLTLNALQAAGEVLLPTPTEFLALLQLEDLLSRLPATARFNPKLQVLGILPTLYVANTKAGQEAHAHIIEKFGRNCRIFDPIPRTVRFQEAAIAGVPIFEYLPKHPGALAYKKLAQEVDR